MLRRLIPLAVLVVFAAIAALACGGDEEQAQAVTRPSPPPPPAATAPATPLPPTPTGPGPVTPGPVTEVTVTLTDAGGPGPFSFDPADLTFDAGETVDFTFVSESQFHTFTVAELGIDVDVLGGETVSFQYTFDEPGTYTLICIPHESQGMVGTITVGPSTGGAAPVPLPPAAAAATAKTVKLDDAGGPGPFSFDPADLTFDAGETVDFTFVSESQFHTFTVAELDIDVDVLGGETVSFQYTFDEPGTYTLICIPHESQGMVGTITVGPSTGGTAPAPPPPAPAAATAKTVKLDDAGGPGPFSFDPADLTFDAGETVDFTFVSESQFHTFTVAELGIDVDVLGGETVSFQYIFDEPGTYTLICIPHESQGMVGTITVR